MFSFRQFWPLVQFRPITWFFLTSLAPLISYKAVVFVHYFCLSTDGISNIDQPGIVATQRIKKLIMELKQCVYMEASPLTGENVDLVFNTGWCNSERLAFLKQKQCRKLQRLWGARTITVAKMLYFYEQKQWLCMHVLFAFWCISLLSAKSEQVNWTRFTPDTSASFIVIKTKISSWVAASTHTVYKLIKE